MYGTNSKGRTIHRGLRGGFYVLEGTKKIYKKSASILPVVTGPSPGSSNVNTKGRRIHKGPRGGFYVIDTKTGRKIYKFTRKVPVVRPSPSPKTTRPSPEPAVPLSKRVGNKLLKLLTNVRKRKIDPNTTGFITKRKQFKIKRFETIDPNEKYIKTKEKSFYVNVPSGTSKLTDLIKNGTVMGVTEDTLPLQSWLDAQGKYLASLKHYDLFTAMSYTVRSHQWIGPWLRGKGVRFTKPKGFTLPLYSQVMKLAEQPKYTNARWAKTLTLTPENMRFKTYEILLEYDIPIAVINEAMEMYVKDLQRIIRGAPPLPKTMYLYRGLYTNIFDKKLGTVHTFDEFASGAYVPQKVYAGNSYIRMKILKGTRVLLLQGLNKWSDDGTGEYEVLINKGSQYVIRKRYLKRYTFNVRDPRNWYTKTRPVTDVTVFK